MKPPPWAARCRCVLNLAEPYPRVPSVVAVENCLAFCLTGISSVPISEGGRRAMGECIPNRHEHGSVSRPVIEPARVPCARLA